ncbi:MAG TPA: sulfatase-like hydrolase/transferase [Pirellulales bacterium]|nr:sulfatase-like hydrolase/transferase [Pirellulales bacterium]
MKRRFWFSPRGIIRLAVLPFVTSAIVTGTSHGDDTKPSRKPNIVVIVADDLGYADPGFQGGKDIPTPHLDALASSGTRFTAGYVSGPYCSPTRAGLLTGRYQQRFGHEFNPGGANNDEIGLPLIETTIADALKPAGYVTGLVGKWHLGGAPKFHPQKRGFDEFFGFLGGAHPYFAAEQGKNGQPILRGNEIVEEREYLTDALGREAVTFIDRHRQQPFLLLLTFNAVHLPAQAPAKYLDRFGKIEDEKRRTYAAMLSALDDNVGAVLGKLRDAQLDEDTLVFFISDNGGPPANGSKNDPLNGRKATVWEGGVRVPFLARWKGHIPAGATLDQPVIQLDIPATIAAVAGTELGAGKPIDGKNLLPLLTGVTKEAPHQELYWRFGQQWAIRDGQYKLLKVDNQLPQLFDLLADVGEKHDLATARPGVVEQLRKQYGDWNAQLEEPRWKPAARQNQQRKRQQPADAAGAGAS